MACAFGDASLKPKGSAGDAFGGKTLLGRPEGYSSYLLASGGVSANVFYAMAAQRYMQRYGATSEQLGAIAVAQRGWAADNPAARFREPLTLAEHQDSPMIADPLHKLDCSMISNGGVAVIVTSAERARSLAQPPVDVLGWGEGHPGQQMARGSDFGLKTGAALAGPAALRMARVSVADVDAVELYDSYTYTVLVTLEDYGFCAKGEGGDFVAEGHIARGGSLPCNTGGGQLSAFNMAGFTPLHEAVVQARGAAGRRQIDKHDVIMVSGSGGLLEHHSTLVLGGAS